MSDIIEREKFKSILLELAENQDLLQSDSVSSDICRRLEDIYCPANKTEHFRHFYSDVFEVLSSVKKGIKQGTVDILGQNMRLLYKRYLPTSENHDISKELMKLYDHISLDIARMNYSDSGDNDISKEQAIKDIQTQVVAIEEGVSKAQKEQDRLKDELSSQQREYVAILSIFATVVMAFTGGLAFSSSVLNNIDKVSTGKLMMIALTIGLVLINILFGLFYYVNMLIHSLSSSVDIKPLWFSIATIIVLMCFALYLCYGQSVDNQGSSITLSVQVE